MGSTQGWRRTKTRRKRQKVVENPEECGFPESKVGESFKKGKANANWSCSGQERLSDLILER